MAGLNSVLSLSDDLARYLKACGKSCVLQTKPVNPSQLNGLRFAPEAIGDTIKLSKQNVRLSTQAIRKTLSKLTNTEFETKVDDFINNIDTKNLREIKAYEMEYYNRVLAPSIKNIRIKEELLSRKYDYKLQQEIDVLYQKYEILQEKFDILQNARERKWNNIFNTISKNQNNMDVGRTVSPRSYLNDEEFGILNSYYDMCEYNDILREGSSLSKDIKREIEILDNAFKKAPELQENATVYRAVMNSQDDVNTISFIDNLTKGALIRDKAYISTGPVATGSTFQEFAIDAVYTDGAIMRIQLPKGLKTIIQPSECLLPRNSTLKITGVNYIDDVRIVDAEYVLSQ